MTWSRASRFLSLLPLCTAACLDVDDDPGADPDESAIEQDLLPAGGAVHLAIVPYFFTDTDLAQRPPVTGGGGPGWDLPGLAFAGTGTDDATGSVKGFWSRIGGGRISVQGVVFPWVPAISLRATAIDQRSLWRPMDDWYSPPDHQVAGFPCFEQTWGGGTGPSNVTTLLATDPNHVGLLLCRDPDGDTDHFWSRDGNGPYHAGSPCPLGGTAQPPQAGKFFCIHKNLDVVANVEKAWSLIAASGSTFFGPGVSDTGAAVITPYRPADWQGSASVALYGHATGVAGHVIDNHRVYISLDPANRGYAFYNALHESGHALGLQHAWNMECASGGFGAQPAQGAPYPALGPVTAFNHAAGGCVRQPGDEYGNYNFMGGAGSQLTDGYDLLAVGALAPASLLQASGSGTYTLGALSGTTPTVLRAATGMTASALGFANTGAAHFYLDYRPATAGTFDHGLPPSFAGVEVKVAPDFVSEQGRCGASSSCTGSFLLDMHPETADAFHDAPLGSGDSFTDPAAGLTMQATLSGATAAIDVTFAQNLSHVLFVTAAGGGGTTFDHMPGALRSTQALAGFGAWTSVTGTNGGGLLFYRSNGVLWASRLDATGHYASVGQIVGTTANVTGWTHITPVGRDGLVFYNASTGNYLIATLSPGGTFAVKASGTGWGGWTSIVGMLDGAILWYSATDGRFATGTIDRNGAVTDMSGAQFMAAGYDRAAPVRTDAVVLYNSATGAVRVVQVGDQRTAVLRGTGTWGTGYSVVVGGLSGLVLLYRASDGGVYRGQVTSGYVPSAIGVGAALAANQIATSAGGRWADPPAVPLLDAALVSCSGTTTHYAVTWAPGNATAVEAYDVDVKVGAAAWQDRYDGLGTSLVYNGLEGRIDRVRARACSAMGCSAFATMLLNEPCALAP